MSFETKKEQALAILAKTGIWESNYAPPALKALWVLGFKIPPPHFARFGPTAISLGVTFGVLYGLLMWLFVWSHQRMSPLVAIIASLFAGVFFGLLMAAYYAYGKRKYKLPDWQSLDDGKTPT
jgi:hypothetical protein